MSHYKSNVRDLEFNLFEVLRRDELLGQGLGGDGGGGGGAGVPSRAGGGGGEGGVP